MSPPSHLGLIVLGCQDSSHLRGVLEGSPPQVLQALGRVLGVVDDAPLEHALRVDDPRVEIVRNTGPLGSGARQKAGYRRALQLGLDPIVVLRGDGHHSPEVLPAFLGLIERGADVVVGSRLLDRGRARQEGMARRRVLGLAALSWAQRRLSGLALSEFHSGYRVVRAAAVTAIGLDDLTDGRGFDSELLLALHERGFRIEELPIPPGSGGLTLRRVGPYALRCLSAGARAWVANKRGVLAFPGPPNLPPSDAPSVAPLAPPTPTAPARGRRPLPVVD